MMDDLTLGALLAEFDLEFRECCGGQYDCPCSAVDDDVPPVRVNVDGFRPLHARELHCVGQAWSNGVTSDVYVVDGIRCHRDVVTGAVWCEDGASFERVRVRQPTILRAIERLVAHDRAVQDARDAYAAAQAGDDPLLTTVLRLHLWYKGGILGRPVVRDGIAFYVVGRNASHQFSIGVRDGQRYVRSYCAEDGADAEHVRAVPT